MARRPPRPRVVVAKPHAAWSLTYRVPMPRLPHRRELAAEFASEDVEHAAQLAQCKFIFVEPMPWMGDLTATHRQTIRCKGCSAEIGEYCVEGHRCSCGRAVAGPCIRLSTERLHMSDLGHAGPSVVRANAHKPPKLPPTHTVPRHRRQPGRSVSLAT